jgi:subtilase family serine protease
MRLPIVVCNRGLRVSTPRVSEANILTKECALNARVGVRLICLLLPGVLTLHAQSGQTGQGATNAGPDIISGVTKVKGLKFVMTSSAAPTDAFCRANLGTSCYSPQEMRKAYGVAPILEAGYTGAGQTIIIIDSFGSPTIASDLHSFDVGYGLPDPPSLTVLAPLGAVPFDPTNSDAVGWAFETTLDVEWAHAMAPGAKIVLLTSPVDETNGVQGMPEFLSLEQYALDHNLGKIISQSWGTAENTLFTPEGEQVLANFESFYQEAAQQNVTVLASAGDSGSANVELNGTTFYPFPTVSFPASSPFVTAVGGTSLYLDTSGNYQSETVWNNSYGAGGGGVSQQFTEPSYQYWLSPSVQKIMAGHRGIPDVAYNADPNTPILVYISFLGSTSTGYYFTGGTSEGSPQWAGIVADLNQLVGHPLGFLNPQLYSLGAVGLQTALFHDITVGNNGFAGLPGYSATVGFDLASGWGTPDVTPSPAKLTGLAVP